MLLRYFDLSNLFNFMQFLPPAWIEKTYYYTNDFDLKSKISITIGVLSCYLSHLIGQCFF